MRQVQAVVVVVVHLWVRCVQDVAVLPPSPRPPPLWLVTKHPLALPMPLRVSSQAFHLQLYVLQQGLQPSRFLRLLQLSLRYRNAHPSDVSWHLRSHQRAHAMPSMLPSRRPL